MKGLKQAEAVYQNRSYRAKQLKAEGKKVIGYMCAYPPLEILTALNIIPFRILGKFNISAKEDSSSFRLDSPAHEVKSWIEENPHNINEMPVDCCSFNWEMSLLGIVSFLALAVDDK